MQILVSFRKEGSFACRVIFQNSSTYGKSVWSGSPDPADVFVIMVDSVVDIRYPVGHGEVEFNT